MSGNPLFLNRSELGRHLRSLTASDYDAAAQDINAEQKNEAVSTRNRVRLAIRYPFFRVLLKTLRTMMLSGEEAPAAIERASGLVLGAEIIINLAEYSETVCDEPGLRLELSRIQAGDFAIAMQKVRSTLESSPDRLDQLNRRESSFPILAGTMQALEDEICSQGPGTKTFARVDGMRMTIEALVAISEG